MTRSAKDIALEPDTEPVFDNAQQYNDYQNTLRHVDFEDIDEWTPIPKAASEDAIVTLTCLRSGTLNGPVEVFVDPKYGTKEGTLPMCDHSFLIEKQTSAGVRRFTFDLGQRQDGRVRKEAYADAAKLFQCVSPLGSDNIIKQAGVDLKDIEAIILGHTHFDHTGDVAAFPSNVELILGIDSPPSIKDIADEIDVPLSSLQDRKITILNKTDYDWQKVGSFYGIDWLKDGSLWLFNCPGHKIGHTSALVRVSAEAGGKYCLLGSDTCHHVGILAGQLDCFVVQGNAKEKSTSVMDHLEEAYRSISRSKRLDEESNAFVWLAHDSTVDAVLPQDKDYVQLTDALFDRIKNRDRSRNFPS